MADEEKPYDPTPSRLQKAKREGNVARSAEIATVATFGASVLALLAVLPAVSAAAQRWYDRLARSPDSAAPDLAGVLFGAALTPFVAAIAAGVAANLVQGGGLTFVAPSLKFARLKPSDNLKRMFSGEAAVAAARAAITFATAVAFVLPTAKILFIHATGTTSLPLFGMLVTFGVQRVVASVIGIGAVFAVVDFLLVRKRWLKKLKMSLYEIKKEHTENEGDPRLRGRRRGRHRSLISGAVGSVKKAAFVVTNPTHIAVALEYDPPRIAVPAVLVMGADETAATIRALARERGIPLIENVPLARLLWQTAAVGRSVPRDSFIAVAEIVNALSASARPSV